MALEEEAAEATVAPAFNQLATKLGLSKEESSEAWKSYASVESQCALEGDPVRWWVCAIYLASRPATSSNDEATPVSLAKLVQASGLSVLELLEKLCKWGEMSSNSRRVHEHIAKVQATFAVAAVVFRKFSAAFARVFASARDEGKGRRGARGAKGKVPGVDPQAASLFHFLWTVFIAVKTRLPTGQSEDVMACFHLLLCVVDYARRDLLEQGHTHLLTAEFVNVEEEDDDGSIIHQLCGVFGASVLDAKHFRVHWWEPALPSLVVDGLLPTAAEAGVLAAPDSYRAAQEAAYEEAMLRRGEMDERAFLGDEPGELLTPAGLANPLMGLEKRSDKSGDSELLLRMSLQSCLEKISQIRLPTPLSGRSYVIAGDQFCPATPISAAAAAANRLAALVADAPRTIRPEILLLFPHSSQPAPNPPELIRDVLATTAAAFTDAFDDKRTAEALSDEAEALYFRLLDRLVIAERERGHSYGPNSGLSQEPLHRSLIAVAYELVLFSHGEATSGGKENAGSREFPWILPISGLQPVHFYKIIELVIRAEPALSRDMVKHLNMAEESVLEELGWGPKSALWDMAERAAVPACVDVAHPAHLDSAVPSTAVGGDLGPAKRKLEFQGAARGGSPTKLRAVGPSRAAMQPHRASSQYGREAPPASALQLFFRKAYYLASVRLSDLADRLALPERAKQAAWTLLEHCLRDHTDLLKGRHLDQVLMCCVYVAGKLSAGEASFHDIISHYRHQPQAASRVYRNVLLESAGAGTEAEFGDLIQFYNKFFLGRVEEFAKKLPSALVDSKEGAQMSLSPLPLVKVGSLSPRRRVAEGVFVSPLALPAVPASPARPMRYSFSRSPYKDLKAINSMIRQGGGSYVQSRWRVGDSIATRRIHFPSNLS